MIPGQMNESFDFWALMILHSSVITDRLNLVTPTWILQPAQFTDYIIFIVFLAGNQLYLRLNGVWIFQFLETSEWILGESIKMTVINRLE
jgi:hypothetical protein